MSFEITTGSSEDFDLVDENQSHSIRITLRKPSSLDLDFLWQSECWAAYLNPEFFDSPEPNPLEIVLSHDQPPITYCTQPVSITAPGGRLEIYPGAGERLIGVPEFLSAESPLIRDFFMQGLSHAFARQGFLTLHGAAFQYLEFSPLILGDSRSGKSTLTTLALRMGAKVVSDDHLLLSKTAAGGKSVFELESMRPDLHLRSPTHCLLREPLASRLRPASFGGEQRWILSHHLNPQFQRRASPTVILCSTIDRELQETDIQPMPPPAALAEMMRCSSPLFLSAKFPQERAVLMDLISAMIASLPAFRLRLGKDLFDKPEETFQRLADTVF